MTPSSRHLDSPCTASLDRLTTEYERLWPSLVRLAHLLTGSSTEGEDLAQEAFVGLLRHGSVASPQAYLRQSVVNLFINRGKRINRERSYLTGLRESVIEPVAVDDLWPLVRQLPARQRAVFVLRYYLDLSEAEIAEALGCRPGTVKAHASRALTRLRKDIA